MLYFLLKFGKAGSGGTHFLGPFVTIQFDKKRFYRKTKFMDLSNKKHA